MRATYLLVSDIALLNAWAEKVREMFHAAPYLVGSALERPDFRDVDVRLLLWADPEVAGSVKRTYDRLATSVSIEHLNLAVSLWGQKVTGLPIDFQVQQAESANEDFTGRRHPLGLVIDRAEGVAS